MGVSSEKSVEKKLQRISIESLEPLNYRDVTGDFEDIRNSMLEKGQLEPVTVTPKMIEGKESGTYIIVNGERRYRAAKNIIANNVETAFDFSKLDCIVDRSYNLDLRSEDFKLNQLILNEVRKTTTFDTYLAVKSLVDSKKYNKTQISKALGKDDTWAGKISNLIIDNESFRCFFSGSHMILNNQTGEIFNSQTAFQTANSDIMTEQDKDRLEKFLRSKEVELPVWEKENGPLFENPELKKFQVNKGFGDDSAPSIWGALKLVEFWNDFCVDHERKSEALNLFNKMIKTLMMKRRKSKGDIDSLVKAIREKYFENSEPQKTEKESSVVTPADMAKKIFNLFKDIEFSEEQLKETKKELRFLLKDPKHRDRVKVDISFALKQIKDEVETENA